MIKSLALLPNRISKTLSQEKKSRIAELLKLIAVELGEKTIIPDAEYKKLAKIGDKNKHLYGFLKDVMDKNPEYINSDLPIEEVTKDKTYFEDLDEVRAMLAEFVYTIIDHEQGIVGAEYRNATGIFEANVAAKIYRNDAKAILVQDLINKAYKDYDRTVAVMQDAQPKDPKPPIAPK